MQKVCSKLSPTQFENNILPWACNWDDACAQGMAHQYVHVGKIEKFVPPQYEEFADPTRIVVEGYPKALHPMYWNKTTKVKIGQTLQITYVKAIDVKTSDELQLIIKVELLRDG